MASPLVFWRRRAAAVVKRLRDRARTRYAAIVLLVALARLAGGRVLPRCAPSRTRAASSSRWTINDFDALARSYDYNPAAFLDRAAARRPHLARADRRARRQRRRRRKAYATTGAALLNQARISPIRDPLLAALVSRNRIAAGAVYLLVSDPPTYHRYRAQLALHFMPKSVRVLARDAAVADRSAHADRLLQRDRAWAFRPTRSSWRAGSGCWSIPRFQNDERFAGPQIDATFDDVLRYDPKVSTVIFFGLRNQVLGYPDHLQDTADAFQAPHRSTSARSRRTTRAKCRRATTRWRG